MSYALIFWYGLPMFGFTVMAYHIGHLYGWCMMYAMGCKPAENNKTARMCGWAYVLVTWAFMAYVAAC